MTGAGPLRFVDSVKSFGGTQALRGVSIKPRRGENAALLGKNGAGKLTLINVLDGIRKGDPGEITIDGPPCRHGRRDGRDAARLSRRKHKMKKASLFTASAFVAIAISGAARADNIMTIAKARVAAATQRAGAWDGPTTGPKAAPDKTIVYVAGDLRNGGTSGVADGVKEATTAIGWKLKTIDGQGQVSTRTTALSQAIALKPDGIIVSGFDAIEQNAALARLKAAGIPFVGWHATIEPGPDPKTGMFANVNTRILDVANTAADLAIVDSGGKAGVVIFGDSNYAMAIGKAKMMEAEIQKCSGCVVLSLEDSPMTEASSRMPQLTTSLLQRYGDKWTYSLAVNDLYYDFMGPSLASAGKGGADTPKNISAGDGSESAFQRIRMKQYQMATVPEPLHQQGWQLVDELNRAFAKQPWSGYVSGIHLVTADNIAYDGGPKNVFDPDNGYRDVYKKIWGVK